LPDATVHSLSHKTDKVIWTTSMSKDEHSMTAVITTNLTGNWLSLANDHTAKIITKPLKTLTLISYRIPT